MYCGASLPDLFLEAGMSNLLLHRSGLKPETKPSASQNTILSAQTQRPFGVRQKGYVQKSPK